MHICAARTQSDSPDLTGAGVRRGRISVERTSDSSEGVAQAGCDRRYCGGYNHRKNRSEEAVFDGRNSRFISRQLTSEMDHETTPNLSRPITTLTVQAGISKYQAKPATSSGLLFRTPLTAFPRGQHFIGSAGNESMRVTFHSMAPRLTDARYVRDRAQKTC
jgi:hypothetical protein